MAEDHHPVLGRREDRLDAAAVLGPEAPYTEALLVAYATAVAIGDTLGALIPPAVPVTFGWPDRILLNGATVGGMQILCAETESEDAVPDWMVAGLQIAVKLDLTADPGLTAGRTSLAEEGIVEVGAAGAPDIYERPVTYLDAVARKDLGRNFNLGLKATNLLNMAVRTVQGDAEVDAIRDGWRAQLSLGWGIQPN